MIRAVFHLDWLFLHWEANVIHMPILHRRQCGASRIRTTLREVRVKLSSLLAIQNSCHRLLRHRRIVIVPTGARITDMQVRDVS